MFEIGFYIMYLAARKEKEVLISSVAGNFLAAEHIEYKDIFKQVMSSPPTPTVGLAALIAAIELGSYSFIEDQFNYFLEIYLPIQQIRSSCTRCLADLTVIVNRPPKGILDGVVRNLEHSIRSCALSDLISIVTDEPIFTLLWHRAAHLLGLHINGNTQCQNRLLLTLKTAKRMFSGFYSHLLGFAI
jgi:hypothetical protein